MRNVLEKVCQIKSVEKYFLQRETFVFKEEFFFREFFMQVFFFQIKVIVTKKNFFFRCIRREKKIRIITNIRSFNS